MTADLNVVFAHALIRQCDIRLAELESENKVLRNRLETIQLTRNLKRNVMVSNLDTIHAFPHHVRMQILDKM